MDILFILLYLTNIGNRFAVRNPSTGQMQEISNVNNVSTPIYIKKDDHHYISNQIIIRTHDIFRIEDVAFDYNLTISKKHQENVLISQSAITSVDIERRLNRDERVIYAEVLDAYDMQKKNCECSSISSG